MTPEDTEKLLNEAVAFLEGHGWKVVVIGGVSVTHPVGNLKYNYELCIKFSGAKKDDD